MLLVKGKKGKSVILNIISQNTKNITIAYYNQPVIDGLFINSDTMDFKTFIFELSKYVDTINNKDKTIDYLIIYTNQGEPTIKNQKELFQKWENVYGFQVIIGCQ